MRFIITEKETGKRFETEQTNETETRHWIINHLDVSKEYDVQVKYRIANIQKIRLSGKNVKTFAVFEYCWGFFVYQGTFSAPIKTANKNLHYHIT